MGLQQLGKLNPLQYQYNVMAALSRLLRLAVIEPLWALERLTEPPDLLEADEGAVERGEGLVDIGSVFVAHGEAKHAVQPSMGPLDYPAVAAKALAALHAAPGDAWPDVAGAALAAAAPVVAALVGVQLVRSLSRSTAPAVAHGPDGIQHGYQHMAVMLVGGTGQHAVNGV